MGVIIFNGKRSTDYGIVVEHFPNYSSPESAYQSFEIPGRNGDVHIDYGTFKNVKQEYEIAAGSFEESFTELNTKIASWLYSTKGYARLEDSYSPNYFRLARYLGASSFENILDNAARATVTFDCKPQRFLKSGEEIKIFTSAGSIYNPTQYESLPRIKVNGTAPGKLLVGDYAIDILKIDGYIYIDSDLKDAYKLTNNLNSDVKVDPTWGFPKIKPGEVSISFDGGITSVEVLPRWWIV